MNLRQLFPLGIVPICLFLLVAGTPAPLDAMGVLKLKIIDRDSKQPVAVRVVMIGPRGREVPIRRATDAGVGWAIDGEVDLEVPSGNYQFILIRGPEYRVMTGNFTIDRTAEDSHTVSLERFVDTQAENWLAGDLMVDRRLRDLPLLMRAEDLDIVALTTLRTDASTTTTAAKEVLADALPDAMQITLNNAADQREGSGLLMIGTSPDLTTLSPAAPSGLLLGGQTANQVERYVVQNPFAWDLPIWLASGKIDGFALMGDFLQYDRTTSRVPAGRPAADRQYDNPLGLGFWAGDIYQNLLEAGFRVPPIAGSGTTRNPIGYNRVYVHCGDSPTPEAFWQGLWEGKSVITNGPLLRPRLDQQYPGYVFRGTSGQPLQLQMDMQLGTRDPVDYMEVLFNGNVIYTARLEEFKENKGIIPRFTFEQSGWVIARVITGYEKHYRAAVSAPWYIEFDDQPRISRRGVQFFIDWLKQREAMLMEKPAEYIQAVAPMVRAARSFWADRLTQATND